MNKLIEKILWITVVAVLMGISSPSQARAESVLVANVPFAFIVGDKQLPAGNYVVKDADLGSSVLSIASTTGDEHMNVLTIPWSPSEISETGALVFDRFEGLYFLARFVPANGDDAREIPLTRAGMERDISQITLSR